MNQEYISFMNVDTWFQDHYRNGYLNMNKKINKIIDKSGSMSAARNQNVGIKKVD